MGTRRLHNGDAIRAGSTVLVYCDPAASETSGTESAGRGGGPVASRTRNVASWLRCAAVRDDEAAVLRDRLDTAEHELGDLRAIRDALTPAELPQRPGLDLAAAFLPPVAEQVSGDFYLVAEGPQDSTVLVVGDVVGHGFNAARRAAFARTAFAATAPSPTIPAGC